MAHIRGLVAGNLHDITHWSAVSLSDGKYYISSMLDESRALDITDGSRDRGARTQLYLYNHSAAQQYSFARNADGSYTITNVGSGKVLDVSDGQAEDGAMVSQWDANGTVAQKWYIRDAGDGYVIQSALGNWVLDVNRVSTANGTFVALYSSNDSGAQRFLLSSVSPSAPTTGTVRIASATNGGLVADIPGGRAATKVNLQTYMNNGTIAQRWVITRQQTRREVLDDFAAGHRADVIDGVYEPESGVKTGMEADVAGGSKSDGANVRLWTSNGSGAQRWSFTHDSRGYVTVTNVGSGKVLSISGDRASQKANVMQRSNRGAWSQKWIAVANGDGSVVLV